MEKLDQENDKDKQNDLNYISNINNTDKLKEKEEEAEAEDEGVDAKDEMKSFKEMNELLFNKKFKKGEHIKDVYKFWDTQPVTNFKEPTLKIGPIDDKNDLEAVRKEPLALPKNFFWQDIDIKNKKDLQQVRFFLTILLRHYYSYMSF